MLDTIITVAIKVVLPYLAPGIFIIAALTVSDRFVDTVRYSLHTRSRRRG